MKKFLLSLVILAMLITAVGCRKEKYPPVKSSDEEAEVIMTLSLDGEEYEVKYELYRALFLSNRRSVDGGDESVWSGSEKDAYIACINEIIEKKASDIYAVLHLAEKLNIDPYSREVEEQIDEYIRISVEGNDADVIGFGGDYDAYLASLAEQGLNYSVQELLIRYSILLERINEYYKGIEDEALGAIAGEYEYSEEDVRAYYFGDGCARLLHAYIQDGVSPDTYAKMGRIREGMLAADGELAVALCIINNTSVTPTDLIKDRQLTGIIVGKNTLSEDYTDYTDAAFSLLPREISEIITVNDGVKGYYIIYKLDKTEEHLERCYGDIVSSYLDDLIGGELLSIADDLVNSAEYENSYSKINHGEINFK